MQRTGRKVQTQACCRQLPVTKAPGLSAGLVSPERECWTRRIVICGGGIIGCAVAYYLAKRGTLSTIVERGDIACASSGMCSTFHVLHRVESLKRTLFR